MNQDLSELMRVLSISFKRRNRVIDYPQFIIGEYVVFVDISWDQFSENPQFSFNLRLKISLFWMLLIVYVGIMLILARLLIWRDDFW